MSAVLARIVGTLDVFVGSMVLAGMFIRTRCSFKDPYWQWRLHTAFGRGAPSKSEQTHALLRYAQWIGRTRRGA